MNMFYYILFWVCIIGLCLGSFYNVVILRSLNNESIVFPASKCPKCNHKLYFWQNIPVVSYIFLKGKCYFCNEQISIQYPLIELITMVMFALSYIKFGVSFKTLFVMLIVSGFIIMTVTDLKEKLVDCNIAIMLGVVGIIYNIITGGIHGLVYSILGLAAGALILEAAARLGYLFVGDRAMGEADTYVAAALGAIFGIYNIVPVLLYSLIASMVFIVPIFLYNQFKDDNKKTCILSVLFILSILIFENLSQNYFSLTALILIGILLVISILRSIKNENNRNYLPYVPALAAGAFYAIFYAAQI